MAPMIIALFLSLGSAVWIYSKFYNKTGGNNKTSITAAAVSGGVIFLVSWVLFGMLAQ